jgi:hypothetical protein
MVSNCSVLLFALVLLSGVGLSRGDCSSGSFDNCTSMADGCYYGVSSEDWCSFCFPAYYLCMYEADCLAENEETVEITCREGFCQSNLTICDELFPSQVGEDFYPDSCSADIVANCGIEETSVVLCSNEVSELCTCYLDVINCLRANGCYADGVGSLVYSECQQACGEFSECPDPETSAAFLILPLSALIIGFAVLFGM